MTAQSEVDAEPGTLPPMPELTIKAGRRSEVMQDDRRSLHETAPVSLFGAVRPSGPEQR